MTTREEKIEILMETPKTQLAEKLIDAQQALENAAGRRLFFYGNVMDESAQYHMRPRDYPMYRAPMVHLRCGAGYWGVRAL